MISIHDISKTYTGQKKPALKDISLEINSGEIFGVIGPDGAGKTTLFRILTTLLLADKGDATVNGFDVVRDYKNIRSSIGYMPGRFSLYQDLSIEENLDFFATVFNTTVQENYHLIKDIYVQIEPFKKRRAGKLSGGMKQKLALCCALIHKPEVLFLDEPTTGVDPVSRKEFWQMLHRLKRQGITIVVSTPYMDEASQCDRIAFLQEGQILAVNTPEGVVKEFPLQLFSIKTTNMYAALNTLRVHPEINLAYAFGESAHATFTSSLVNVANLNAYLQQEGITAQHIELITPSIEDSFIELLQNNG